MRNLPGLTTDVFNRAAALSVKARDSRAAVPNTQPSNSISPARVEGTKATIRLYDYIDPDGGYWGISADEFAQALDDAATEAGKPLTEVLLRVNSGGGSVWDGLAILNQLRTLDAKVTAMIDGVAASAASFISIACDEVIMNPNSRLMIHDAMGLCIGQAADMREYADFLEESSSNIAEIYATRAGGTTEEWRQKMTDNGLMGTWFSAQDAVDAGLADKVGGQEDDAPLEPGNKAPVASSCACGPNGAPAGDGYQHKDECSLKAPAPAPAPEPVATFDYSRKHGHNSRAFARTR